MIEVFEEVYLAQNANEQFIQNWPADTVWGLSVKLMDLNTNLTNPSIK